MKDRNKVQVHWYDFERGRDTARCRFVNRPPVDGKLETIRLTKGEVIAWQKAGRILNTIGLNTIG